MELELTKQQSFILKLSRLYIKEPLSFVEIERKIGYRAEQSDLRIILNYFISEGILEVAEKIGNIKRYYIDSEKLDKFVLSSKFWKEMKLYF
jgi:hypothetical protein